MSARICRIVDTLIRDESVYRPFGSSSDAWIDDPERMARCDAAAADGADGSTYAEVIADWRQQIGAHVYHNRRKGCARNRLAAAVDRHFDALEAWHESNGTLHAEIG